MIYSLRTSVLKKQQAYTLKELLDANCNLHGSRYECGECGKEGNKADITITMTGTSEFICFKIKSEMQADKDTKNGTACCNDSFKLTITHEELYDITGSCYYLHAIVAW